MKKMNISHNSKHFLNVLLLILMLVGINTNAWAAWPGSGEAVKNAQGNYIVVDGNYFVLYDNTEREISPSLLGKHVEYNYNLQGPGATLTFQARRTAKTAVGNLHVAQNVNNNWSDVYDNNPGTGYEGSGDRTLNVDATELSFYNDYGSYTRKFKDVHVTMAQYIENPTGGNLVAKDGFDGALTFGEGLNVTSSTVSRTFTIAWCNVPALTTSLSGGASTQYSVVITNNSEAGKFNTATVTVTYNHTAAGTHNETLTISGTGYSKRISLSGSAVAIEFPVYEWRGANTYYVDDVLDLQDMTNIWHTTSDAVRTFTIETYSKAMGINNNDSIQPYIEDNRYLHLGKACTIKIKLTQPGNAGYYAGSDEKILTVNKRTPAFTWDGDVETNYTFNYFYNTTKANIFFTTGEVPYTVVSDNEFSAKVDEDNTLRVYNVAEDAHITVSQPENYKWNAHEKTYTIHPYNNANIHVPFTLSSGNHAGFEPAGAFSYAVWNGNGYRFGDDNPTDAEDGYAIIHFEGVPDKLYFDKSLERFVLLPQQRMCVVYESANKIDWSPIWMNNEEEEETNNNVVQLSATTRYIKFTYNGTINANYTNIRVTERNIFKITPEGMLNFGDQGLEYGEQAKTATFEHANAGRITNVEIKGADASYFTVSPTTIVGTGRDFYGIAHLDIRFDNMGENRGTTPYTARLVITDNAGRGDSIVLQARRFGKNRPEFTWNPNSLPYYFNSNIANVASSTNLDVPLTFSSSNESIAKVDENGILRIYNTGSEVTITVRQAANADFESGVASYTFTPRKRPDLSVPFQVTDNTFYTKHVQAGSKCKWDDGGIFLGGKNYLTDDWVWEHEGKNFVIEFAETPGKLSFTIQSGSILCTGTSHMWQVEESSTGVSGDWSTVWYYGYKETDGKTFSEIELKPSTRFLRFTYRGNYWGYFKNINVSELVGYKYLRAEQDGKYLSRGAKWGTQAVVGPFGIPCRISRYTRDNTNIYTRFLYLDNQQYLYEADNHELFTDDGTAANTDNMWKINNDGGILTIQSGNEVTDSHKGYYVTIDGTNALALTNNVTLATQWRMEDYTEHASFITTMLDREASAAAAVDFGTDVNTLAKVRTQIKTNDFEKIEMRIPALSLGEQTGEYRSGVAGTNAVYDQMVDTLKPGFYRLTVKAFYRTSPSTNAWKCHDEGKESVVAYVYANDVKYPIQSVYDSYQAQLDPSDELHEGHYYPATLTSADLAYDEENRYLNDVYVYVEADAGKTTGTLRYGIKNPSYVPGAWLAYEDITLTRISRKEYIFKGETVEGETTDWQIGGNWDRESQPTKNHAVYVQHDLIIDEEVEVYSLTIENDKSGNPVTVTIAPNGGLTVGAGGVRGASAEKLILKAGTAEDGALKGQTGYLRISPYSTQPMPEATVELFSIGYYDYNDKASNIAKWQYVGSPLANDETLAKTVYTKSWVYGWNENSDEWTNQRSSFKLRPFVGFATTQRTSEDGMLVRYAGELVSSQTKENIALAYSGEGRGHNVLANSFSAPIDITKFEDSDFKNADSVIYIFNTGSRKEADSLIAKKSYDVNAPGQYLAIPIGSARLLKGSFGMPTVIASMQGFCVHAHKADAQITLDYSKLVWNGDYAENPNAPARISAHREEEETQIGNLQISLYTDGGIDYLFLLESDQFDALYESGFDARKLMGDELNVFSVANEEHLAVDATNSIIGTRVGVRTGDETAYTFVFGKVRSENELALLDYETNQTIDINEGTEYTFFAEPNSMIEDRFQIVERENAPAITTDIENVEKESKAHKFIKGDRLFILKNGVLYNAVGAVVR